MAGGVGKTKGPMADINVTPLIDVVLVLLVVFMVVTPMLQSGMAVDLPKATQTTTIKDVGQNIVVSITTDQGWWVEQTQVDKDTIIDAINAEFRENPARGVLIKADGRLEYGKVREVMDIIADNGMTTQLVAASKEE